MSARAIPPRPSLEFDRKQAKVLLDAARAGDPAALARFHAHHPRFRAGEARDAALHDAQLVIDPGLARHRGGPLDREPILYACFSRFLRTDAARAAGIVAIVRRLLDRRSTERPVSPAIQSSRACCWPRALT